MTHPKRFDRSLQLPGKYPEWDLRVVPDPFPEQKPRAIRAARAAWRAVGSRATHHLVIQDDVDFPPSFFGHVVAAAAQHPDKALAFFAEWGSRTSSAIRIAALRGASWAEVVDEYIPTQALLLPAELARGAAEFLDTLPDEAADDGGLHGYLAREGTPQLVSVPNLVEHADLPSVSRYWTMGRRRATCYSPESSTAGLRGEAGVLDLTWVPYYAWWDQRAEICVRPNAQSTQWLVYPTLDTLIDDLRVPASFLISACTAGLSSVSTSFRAAGLVPERTMRQLWFTAFALGIAAASGEQPITEDALRSKTAMLALKSFVPGALRVTLRPADLAQAEEALAPAMCAAVEEGYSFVKHSPAAISG
jgi:hypothetical protein